MTETEENVTEEETPDVSEAAGQPAAEDSASEATPEAPAAAAEPEEQLSPKEARKRARSTHAGEVAPQRSIEERQQERAERRARKAQQRRVYRQRVRERRASQPRGESPAPVEEKAGGRLKVRQGVVVSDKADKTITVRIDVAHRHRMYKKIVRTSSTLHAHDEANEANVGDTVRVIESRPLSKTKRWRLVEVLERAR
jgi:small subunit ribosomal protein S17